MTEIRYFNPTGRIKWFEWLESLRENPSLPMPEGLLTNPDYSSRAPGGAVVVPRLFSTKLDLAQTLSPLIAAIRAERMQADRWPGLWDWLAAFYFDSLCPAEANGQRKIKQISRYAFDGDWKRKYRHRIAGPVDLYERLGVSSRILIHGPPSSLTDWEEQAASRNPIASNKGIAEALCRLYWDDVSNAPKRGAAPNEHKRGTLRRFTVLLLQFDRTFDLLSIGPTGILPLLPKEFDRFRPTAS